jgi:nicotinamidase-related amidase
LTEIDPKKTALVVIDMQKGIAAMGRSFAPNSADIVIANSARLAETMRQKGATVILVNVTSLDGKDMLNPKLDGSPQYNLAERPKDWADLLPQIGPKQGDITITKRQWGAFHGTELDLQLRRRGIDMIILCGISTNIGVETTAREAYQHGYSQIFATDAMTASTEAEHNSALNFTFSRIGRLRSTEQIIAML